MMSVTQQHGQPCPYDDRRSSRELYVKFFVVSFSVGQTFFHLMSVRRDYGTAIVPIVYGICSPVTVAFDLLAQLPLLAILSILYRDRTKLISQSFAILVGRIIEKDEDIGNTYWRFSVRSKVSLRSMVILGTIAQCVTSTVLFRRRASSGTAAMYDYYILQLAILGLVAATSSLLHTLFEPVFPAYRLQELPKEVRWLAVLRAQDCDLPNYTISPLTWEMVRDFMSSGAYIVLVGFMTLVSCIINVVFYYCGLETIDLFVCTSKLLVYDLEVYLILLALSAGIILWALIMFWADVDNTREELRSMSDSAKGDFRRIIGREPPLVPIVCCICIVLLIALFVGFSIVFVIVHPLADLSMFVKFSIMPIQELFWPASTSIQTIPRSVTLCPDTREWRRIATFSAVSIECPCPMALKDAAADWLWALV